MKFTFKATILFAVWIVWSPVIRADSLQIFEFNPNMPIPDIDVIEIDFLVEPDLSCPIIRDINVGLLIPHTWQGNLKLNLTHLRTGVSTSLFDQPGVPQTTFGFSADNYGNSMTGELFFLDDEATEFYDTQPLGSVSPPGIENVTGSWLPEGDLSLFDGINASGIWRLRIEDFGGGDVGTLETFSLHITTSAIPEPCFMMAFSISIALLAARRRRVSV